MPERKAVRLLSPIRSGNEVLPENAVVDAAIDVADQLLGANPPLAEETDAIERYPNKPFIDTIDEFPVTGSEKFPKPAEIEPSFAPEVYSTEDERRLALETRRDITPAWDSPEKIGDEASAAKMPAKQPTEEEIVEGGGAPTPAPAPAAAPAPAVAPAQHQAAAPAPAPAPKAPAKAPEKK